ncbi:MAG: hypothetical protein Q4B48_05200, partial [Syntrophomonadaceae bacterium]|nr:hypothetical protein [Syntrophomonadaceae bacterium]
MSKFNEDAFEAAVEIVAATMENTNISIDAKGGAAVAEYFEAIFNKLAIIATAEEEEEEEEEE